MKILDFLTKFYVENGRSIRVTDDLRVLERYASEPANEVYAFSGGYIVTDMMFVPGKTIKGMSGFIPAEYVGRLDLVRNGEVTELANGIRENVGSSLDNCQELAGKFISDSRYHNLENGVEEFRKEHNKGAHKNADPEPGEE